MSIKQKLNDMHHHLMYLKFPYHSVSVVHRNDLGFHLIFTKEVSEMITDDLKGYIKAHEFTYRILNK